MSESAISPKSCPKCGAILPSAATAGLCPRCLMAEAMVPSDPGAEPAEAKKMFAPAELAPYFPQLEILECLGRGGMGVVYKARQKSLNRLVALKLLAPERVNDAGFAGRFQTEAQALAKLNHPDIVTVYDFGQAGGLYFLLMEFVDGMNLRQLLNAGRIAPREALAIVPQICDALQYAHDAGIVHRDIKPENILLDRQGRVKVADFGLAKLVGTVEPPAAGVASPQSETTKAGQVMGTPQYMAPEQRDHPSDVDHRADIYSLGVVFYQMLTGELPGKQLEPPSSRMRGIVIDVRLDEVVLRALEKQPDRRYQQASEVKTIVETIATTPVSVGTAVPPSLKSEPAISYAGFWRRAWALVIDLAIVSCVAFLVLLALASYAPDRVVVSSPVGKFTTERIIETKQVPRQNPDGSTTVVEERIVEVTNLGRWKYFYRDKVEHSGGDEKKSRQLIDPVTRQDRQAWTLDMLSMNLLLVYLILLESSPLQGSVGKRLLGIKVVTEQGQ
ncbi:MAG: serine/threonine-protein kinase, partial [Verrucomicrobiota bacterium]